MMRAVLALLMTVALSSAAGAQVARTADGHPDLSGVWWPGRDVPIAPLTPPPSASAPPPAAPAAAPAPSRLRTSRFENLYQPWAIDKARTLSDKDDPALRCVPVAFGTLNVSLYGLGFVGQIVQTPGFVVMLTETYHSFKLIPTDGRKHRDDAAPSFRGDSVGRWEGDTLVVDTAGFNDLSWLDARGHGHSQEMRIEERFHRRDFGHMEVGVTITDPKIFTKPVAFSFVEELLPDTDLLEHYCLELEKDAAHQPGKAGK